MAGFTVSIWLIRFFACKNIYIIKSSAKVIFKTTIAKVKMKIIISWMEK